MKSGMASMSGASLAMLDNPLTKRTYLVVSEGAASKLRLVDVTLLNACKATTLSTVLGPKEVAVGGLDQIYYFDNAGVFSLLDIRPWVTCGNAFGYAGSQFSKWQSAKGTQAVGTTITLADKRVFRLRRDEASGSVHPWDSIWRKKAMRLQGSLAHVTISKSTVCFRSRGYIEYACCVRKDASLTPRSMKLTQAQQRLVLGEMLIL